MDALTETLVSAAVGFTVAVVVTAVVNRLLRRNHAKGGVAAAFLKKLAGWFTRSIFGVLGIGLVWTVYFTVIGLVDERRAEYAANAATLIVSVLTVFSIMIAFYEFMARGKREPEPPPKDQPGAQAPDENAKMPPPHN